MSSDGEMASQESPAEETENENDSCGNINLRRRKFVECAQETIEQGKFFVSFVSFNSCRLFSSCFSASELIKRKIPCAGHFLAPKRLWLRRVSTPNCDVVLVFPPATEDSILLWLLARLRQSPGLTVHVRHHASTQCSAFYLAAPFSM